MFLKSELKEIILFSGKVDFRKRFDGLLNLCYQNGYDPYKGNCVVFVSRNCKEIRAFFGDVYGLYLVCRLFEGRSKQAVRDVFKKKAISEMELSFLFDGANVCVTKRVSNWKKTA